MTAKVVAIAQQKGGAGKTTIAVQLGVAWAMQGRKVALLDIDPQGSLAAWFALRQPAAGVPLEASAIAGWKLATEIDRLRSTSDMLIIDTPPHAETDARVAVRAADAILLPVQPSPMDLWATKATLELAQREKTRALLVLNRVPARGRLVDAIKRRIAADGMPLAAASLGNRSAFAASMTEGRGVAETQPKGPAAAEVRALAEEIERFLAAADPVAAR